MTDQSNTEDVAALREQVRHLEEKNRLLIERTAQAEKVATTAAEQMHDVRLILGARKARRLKKQPTDNKKEPSRG